MEGRHHHRRVLRGEGATPRGPTSRIATRHFESGIHCNSQSLHDCSYPSWRSLVFSRRDLTCYFRLTFEGTTKPRLAPSSARCPTREPKRFVTEKTGVDAPRKISLLPEKIFGSGYGVSHKSKRNSTQKYETLFTAVCNMPSKISNEVSLSISWNLNTMLRTQAT